MTVAAFIGQVLIGWLLADLVGGVLHWLEDRVFSEQTPMLGAVIRDNRLHHDDPMAFTRKTVLERNAGVVAIALALGGIWLMAFGPSVMLVFAVIGGAISNEVHCKAHLRTAGVVRVLQDMGVIQSARVHAGHHRAPQTTRYCPLTDWCNPILDALDVWGRLERLMKVRAA